MAKLPRSDHRSARHPERIEFARDQRTHANEFASDVWQIVRGRRVLGQKFRREYPVPPYTVDFVCLELMLVIEVDGKDHLTDEGQLHDEERDRFLRDRGFIVHRIPGYRVLQDAMSVRCEIEETVRATINRKSGSSD